MNQQYPNKYYEELSKMIISHPQLRLNREEVCFYQGDAYSTRQVTTTKKGRKKGGHVSVFVTPWVTGVHKSATTQKITKTTTVERVNGLFFITNMRLVYKCKVGGFDFPITKIKNVHPYTNGIKVYVGKESYPVMSDDANQIMRVIKLINDAQTPPEEIVEDTYANSGVSYTYQPAEPVSPESQIDADLEAILIKVITQNQGILQSELVKGFPVEQKDDITRTLYYSEKVGHIRREKSGRSYSLYLQN